MKRLTAFCAITGLLLGEAAAEDRIERIDLTRFTCKQFLELNRDDALIVVGWLQGHYLDEHEAPGVDFTKLSVESVTLANRCVARPDENVIAARPRVRQVDFSPLPLSQAYDFGFPRSSKIETTPRHSAGICGHWSTIASHLSNQTRARA